YPGSRSLYRRVEKAAAAVSAQPFLGRGSARRVARPKLRGTLAANGGARKAGTSKGVLGAQRTLRLPQVHHQAVGSQLPISALARRRIQTKSLRASDRLQYSCTRRVR